MRKYKPPSRFLRELISSSTPISERPNAADDIARVIQLMVDENPANRDWATFLLAQDESNTSDVRRALLSAAKDQNEFVRAEAILGLARRDKVLAFPLLRHELQGPSAPAPLFEAAAIVGDSLLMSHLREFSKPSGDAYFDELVDRALRACGTKSANSGPE